MRQAPEPFHEEFRIEGDAALRLGVELDHPAVDPVPVELPHSLVTIVS